MSTLTHASLMALPARVRQAIISLREAGADQAHLATLADEVHRLKTQAGHLMVDRDRGIREASRRALDCEAHGAQLRELEGQVDHYSRTAERNDRARVILLGLAHELEAVHPEATVKGSSLRSVARKALEAHKRAWR